MAISESTGGAGVRPIVTLGLVMQAVGVERVIGNALSVGPIASTTDLFRGLCSGVDDGPRSTVMEEAA